jgi:hypothetical protein
MLDESKKKSFIGWTLSGNETCEKRLISCKFKKNDPPQASRRKCPWGKYLEYLEE